MSGSLLSLSHHLFLLAFILTSFVLLQARGLVSKHVFIPFAYRVSAIRSNKKREMDDVCIFKWEQYLLINLQDLAGRRIPNSLKAGDIGFEPSHTLPQQMAYAFLLEDEKQTTQVWPRVMLDYMRHQIRFRGRTKRRSTK